MKKNCCWALYPFLPRPFRSRRDLGLVEVHELLAPELEPERGGVDDDDAHAGPVLGEGLGDPAEKAEALGAAPRHKRHESRGSRCSSSSSSSSSSSRGSSRRSSSRSSSSSSSDVLVRRSGS
eukprot:135948-Pyramimonas_sp.AAC.1